MIQRILVALDGSPRAPDVVAAAAEIARRFGAQLIPFRAVSVPPEFPPAAHVSAGDPLPKYLDDTARAELGALLANVDADKLAPQIGRGQPWRAILEAADAHDVDLVVIGSHGYGGLDRVLGTTAARVVDVAQRSVLVVHGPRLSSPAPG